MLHTNPPPPFPDPAGSPTQPTALGSLLRTWRTTASARGATITQRAAAEAAGRSERWYRDLEKGEPKLLGRQQCQALADLFGLGQDERQLLLDHAGGTRREEACPDTRARTTLRLLLDRQPGPAFLCDANWNILVHNAAMAAWFPWVLQPGANVIRWALLSPEARLQILDWHDAAADFTALLRYAVAKDPARSDLHALIADVCADPTVRELWTTSTGMDQSHDGRHFRLTLPALGWAAVRLVSHVTYPASLPGCRLTVLTVLQGDDHDPQPADALPQPWPHPPLAPGNVLPQPEPQSTVLTLEDVAAAAGPGHTPLPRLSRLFGPDHHLVLAPREATVIWATRSPDTNAWTIHRVDAHTMIVHVPNVPAAHDELVTLARAALPSDPRQAEARAQALTAFFHDRIHLMERVRRIASVETAAVRSGTGV
jgi:PAS domain-containing protein